MRYFYAIIYLRGVLGDAVLSSDDDDAKGFPIVSISQTIRDLHGDESIVLNAFEIDKSQFELFKKQQRQQ